MVALATAEHRFYSFGRVHALLTWWEELLALAESPVTAIGLAGRDAERPTAETPKLAKQRGHHADPMAFADWVADLERGVSQLASGGLGVDAIRALQTGEDLSSFARHRGRPLYEIEDLYAAAVTKLTRHLEPMTSAGGVG